MKISILGVGTELTTGQILNRNAQWLSRQLYQLGLETSVHLVVPDDRALITESLNFLSQNSGVIFVTGGLGPTSDDFTRDLISSWSAEPLVFHQASWEHLNRQLGARGLPIRDLHRQECFFPSTAEVFQNNVGTANAFMVKKGSTSLFALPGPPKEIEGLWSDFLLERIKSLCGHVDPLRTWSWDCIGLAEAELASRVEPLLRECPLEKAYRVHLPYVEFKLSFHESQRSQMNHWQTAVSENLKPWMVARDGADLARELGQHLSGLDQPIWIYDEVTGSQFMIRLLPEIKNLLQEKNLQFFQKWPGQTALTKTCGVHILPSDNPLQIHLHFYRDGKLVEKTVQAPERFRPWPERLAQFFSEWIIIEWNILLQSHR